MAVSAHAPEVTSAGGMAGALRFLRSGTSLAYEYYDMNQS